MSARSRFLRNHDRISHIAARFERWLRMMNYEGCGERYPAAVLASALVDEYLQEYPEHEGHKPIIENHAGEIGWISDYQEDEETDS